ncbi:MAG TPA: SRPBCC domain-containing protein [Acidimicrobiales bacterium]|nr:SRPBCC domain-containing protein [Acidimicrobiales bacterium]
MDVTGRLDQVGPSVTVTFERELAATPERIWAALTEPPQLAAWLAEAEFDAVEDGAVHLVWPDKGEMHGAVTVLRPHEVLEYSWHEDGVPSLLRFELEPAGEHATTLRLQHLGTTPAEAPGFGAGWQSHLEALDEVLAGGTSTPEARDARYEALRPAYDELLAR